MLHWVNRRQYAYYEAKAQEVYFHVLKSHEEAKALCDQPCSSQTALTSL
jgi:2-methylisocitrate lyase-like PEP mutase family enzyme